MTLPTNIVSGQAGHAQLHNDVNQVVNVHEADTSAVHGIADTSKLAKFSLSNAAGTVLSAVDGTPVLGVSGVSGVVGDDLWGVWGQSNASGRGIPYDTAYLDPTDPRVWQWGVDTALYPGQRQLGVEPIAMHDTPSGIGPAGPFARAWLPLLPTRRRLMLVGSAHGSSGIRTDNGTGTWKVGTNSLYEDAVEKMLAAQEAQGEGSRIAGILWCQGESSSSEMGTYEADLDEIIDQARSDLGVSDLPFVILQMVRAYISGAGRIEINRIHIDTPRRKPNTAFVYGPDGPGDGVVHYDAAQQRILGTDAATGALRALANVLGTQPIAPEVTALTQMGTDLLVDLGQPLCRVTDYVVQWRQGTSGAWSTAARTVGREADARQTISGITKGQTYQVQAASVNAQGTSAFGPVAQIVTVVDPAQVTGLAAGTPGPTSIPLTWGAVAGAAQYLVEYKKTALGVWLTHATVVSPATVVYTLVPSTAYDFRVTAVNAAGSAAASSVATATTAAISLIVSDVGVAAHSAFGVARRLVSGYAGSLVRVRRSSDSAELDIGFDGDVLDVAALLAHCGSGSGYVRTLYDQSGSARNLTQVTASAQPRIVNAGVLESRNGQPVMVFDGTDDIMWRALAGSGMYANGNGSRLLVFSNIGVSNGRWVCESTGTAALAQYALGNSTNQQASFTIRNDANSPAILSGSLGLISADSEFRQMSLVDSGSAISEWVDAIAASGNPVAYVRSGVLTIDRASIGGLQRASASAFVKGAFCEMVSFYSALSDLARGAGEQNQRAFFGTA